ncbi:MAG: PDZ domain-containing protein [Oleispira sp.]|nr:PDZ domain-containing protein [Oleispira sp.]MBL4881043.1 PDZ domain-containing protein [Oleispira sp.]
MSEQTVVLLPWQRISLILAKSVFSVLLASQLAVLTWMILSPPTLKLIPPSQSNNISAQQSQGSIADWHIFGNAAIETIAIPKEVNAPKTRLRLELLGVMAASKPENSSAIIAPKGGAGENYRVGDVVQGRTKLAAVHSDKVILDSNGKLETLKFDLARKQNIRKSSQRTPAQKRSAARGSLKDRFKKVRNAADAVTLLRDEVNNNPAGALKQMGLEAAANGEGYKVSNSGSMLTQLGLQPGDIILSVNGQTLGNLDDDQNLLEQVSNSGQARLEIQRGNRRFVVNHTIK